jgi:SOS response regulatory protein OraA/RecX
MERALRALRRRDHTSASLEAVLARAGASPAERTGVVDRMRSLGYVDDAGFAARRAEALAERGAGDRKIELDLEQHGVAEDIASLAVAGLEPERQRADRIVSQRGARASTVRLLASRGFSEDVIEAIVADASAWELG